MKKLLMVIPLVILLCFTFSCKQGEEPTVEETKEEVTSGTVKIDGFELPYFIEGTGIPCIVINDAPVMRRALSKELREHFKFVFMDPRMNAPYDKSFDLATMTLRTLVDDIERLRKIVGLEKICLLGHSINGLVALEYARTYPEHTTHVIMNGTPPYWNDKAIRLEEEYWESHAYEERKNILKQNWDRMGDEIAKMPPGQAGIYTYIANTPKYWYDPKYDGSWLAEGLNWNAEIWNHLINVIMADYDIKFREKIPIPIFLSLGRYDFVVPYYMWDDFKDKFPNLSYNLFEKSGHWAFLEEQELFDKKLIEWIKSH